MSRENILRNIVFAKTAKTKKACYIKSLNNEERLTLVTIDLQLIRRNSLNLKCTDRLCVQE